MPRASDHAAAVDTSRNGLSWERHAGEGDPEQRFRLYRLCECEVCGGEGKSTYGPTLARWEVEYGEQTSNRCPECRGEGKVRELVATAGTPEAVGVALVTLGLEGEWDECPIGILDAQPEGKATGTWIVKPWLPSTRNVSDAGRLLRAQRSVT